MPAVIDYRVENPDHAEKIEVGNIVRSYDFEYHDDCYVLGKVLRITEPMEGCQRYEIMRLRRTFDGKHIECEQRYFYPPVNGTRNLLGGYTNGVRNVGEELAEYWNERLADWASDVDFD